MVSVGVSPCGSCAAAHCVCVCGVWVVSYLRRYPHERLCVASVSICGGDLCGVSCRNVMYRYVGPERSVMKGGVILIYNISKALSI